MAYVYLASVSEVHPLTCLAKFTIFKINVDENGSDILLTIYVHLTELLVDCVENSRMA